MIHAQVMVSVPSCRWSLRGSDRSTSCVFKKDGGAKKETRAASFSSFLRRHSRASIIQDPCCRGRVHCSALDYARPRLMQRTIQASAPRSWPLIGG